jgi:hypothetical protein
VPTSRRLALADRHHADHASLSIVAVGIEGLLYVIMRLRSVHAGDFDLITTVRRLEHYGV